MTGRPTTGARSRNYSTTTTVAVEATCRPGPPTLSTRGVATGEHAELLVEARARLDAAATVLTAVALDHVDRAEVDDVLLPVIRLIDRAGAAIDRAGAA